MKYITAFNEWYDQQPGNSRFLIFMAAMCVAIFPLEIGDELGLKGLAIFGLIVFNLIAWVAMVRAKVINLKHTNWIIVSMAAMLVFIAICVFLL